MQFEKSDEECVGDHLRIYSGAATIPQNHLSSKTLGDVIDRLACLF